MEIVQRQTGGIQLAVSPGFSLQSGIQPEPCQPNPIRQSQQIVHQQRTAKETAVGIAGIAGEGIPREQPKRQQEMPLA